MVIQAVSFSQRPILGGRGERSEEEVTIIEYLRPRRLMAKKNFVPAVRHIRYDLVNSAVAGTETSHYLDVARDLSILNRRLMKQGRRYHIKRISITSSNTIQGWTKQENFLGVLQEYQQNAGRFSAAVIPNGWVSQKAWQRAHSTWKRMHNEVLKQSSGDITAKWSDFKVFLSNDHRVASITRPIDNGGNQYLQGEWNYTDMASPDGTTGADVFALHMLGDHDGAVGAWDSVGLIKSFGESRATVQVGTPNVPGTFSEDPLLNVFDYGTVIDEVADLIEGENDNPPYDTDEYPGDDTNGPKPLVAAETTISDGRGTLPGFEALCGLIEIEMSSPIESDTYSVLVELSAGSYRGIKADVI
ncbi:MAG: hypothetical protein [Circoviridae sp.]|nr:MAG: hypothetical protein [Circoviridae sp.]